MKRFLSRAARRLASWAEAPADPVEAAVRQAFADVGLPLDQFSHEFDLVKAGKMIDVYILAARTLHRDPAWSTVGHVIDDLRRG